MKKISKVIQNLSHLKNKKIFLTGSTGLIGLYLVDLIMYCNENLQFNTEIIASGRSWQRAKEQFEIYENNKNFLFYEHDIIEPICLEKEKLDYIIHGASNSNPVYYSTDPVGTMLSNFTGMKNVLDLARNHPKCRVLYISSGEVYGEIESESLMEEDYGYVDILNPRSCYPSSKRASETLCVSYAKQYSVDVLIARPSHVYGPTSSQTDYRAFNQFIQNGLKNENIILKSKGQQVRSYTYVGDCVSALLSILVFGESNNAYNVSSDNSIITIKELAEMIAKKSKTKVVMDVPEKSEKEGYSVFNRAVLDNDKLKGIGWKPHYDIHEGITQTLQILKNNR